MLTLNQVSARVDNIEKLLDHWSEVTEIRLARIEQMFDSWDNIAGNPVYGTNSGLSHE
jgi:ABC-type sulfate transport system substrate-binding protein